MASIGIVDLDLWSNIKSFPNLELMKVYNYYYNKNNIVRMVRPTDPLTTFTHIYFFKENPNTSISKKINMRMDNKTLYGYGFYKKFFPLKNEISEVPPRYLPYDSFVERLANTKSYDTMKQSSYIRVENKDFTDYKPDRTNIYIADYDFIHLQESLDFLQEYKKHNFKFTHGLKIDNEILYNQFIRYSNLFDRRLYITFNYSKDFLLENYYENIVLNINKPLNEIIQIILFLKSKENSKAILEKVSNINQLQDYVIKWGYAAARESYYEYYKKNRNAINLAEKSDSNIRLLLKTKPKNYKSSNIDF